MPHSKALIIGAGPCGLAAARELERIGLVDWTVIEAAAGPGGLASSPVDANGFTWDRGGHVVFSHYGEFDRLLTDVMGDDLHHLDRRSEVRVGEAWVPYPLQNNLHRLDPETAEVCLTGLIEAALASAGQAGLPAADLDTTDFATWMSATFGAGIVATFMRPYNEKVWAHPPETMSARWIGERVATVDWRHAVHAVVHDADDVAWGPNNQFAFPVTGGTGEIYRRAAAGLSGRIVYRESVVTVDTTRHEVTTASGTVYGYDDLVWTAPLDQLVACTVDAPDTVRNAATTLVHNSVTVVGIGYEAPMTDERSWLYFPGGDTPFYRATNFARYAAANVPGGRTDRYCSWMTEIASSPWRPLPGDDAALVAAVDASLRQHGLVDDAAALATTHVEHLPYGYPVPSLGRDRALTTIQPWLMAHRVFARGRFGAWRYELGNMDHAVKMGTDVARLIALDEPEQAWSL